MDARFRIRTTEGRELEPRTLEIFSEMVRSGVVRPDDLIFDALTGEWVPAHAHPMVRLFHDPLLADPVPLLPDVGLPHGTAAPARRGSRTLPVVGSVAGAGALVFALIVLPTPKERADPAERVGIATAPSPVPPSEERVRGAALSAFARRVDALGWERGLGAAPDIWLEGRYLADAAAYPQVREYWEGVAAHLAAVEEVEDSLYRAAYLEAADVLGVSGPLRSLRLARALEDFEGWRSERERVYARGREMSAAALALHQVLVELGGRVTYEPARGPRLSADPVLEAAGADPQAERLLERALDRVLVSLRSADGSPQRDRSRLPSWLAEELTSAGG